MSIINPTVIVLWEHELRAAAKALKPFAGKDANPTADDAANMLRACFAAIYSPELAGDDGAVTVMNCRETVTVTKTYVNKSK